MQRCDHLEMIKEEADSVVNDILLGRLRAEPVPMKELTAVDELLESVVARLRPRLQDRDVRFVQPRGSDRRRTD